MTVNWALNNGVQMPALGFGVFQTPPDVTAQAVRTALATGYRLIDTAAAYGNEREVGQAIRHSGLARDDVFIETKIWISDYGYDQTLHAFDKSAGKLGVDRIDLLILHQALPTRFDLTGGVSRAGDPARRRAGAGDRRQQLHARAPRRPAEAGYGGSRGKPGRSASVLHPASRAGRGRRPRRPHPGAGHGAPWVSCGFAAPRYQGWLTA